MKVVDSLPPAPTTDMINQIAAILCTPKDTIRVRYIDVQIHEEYSDCGLFAIAFVTALANEKQPGRCFFDQGTMRAHLIMCTGAEHDKTPFQKDKVYCDEDQECNQRSY